MSAESPILKKTWKYYSVAGTAGQANTHYWSHIPNRDEIKQEPERVVLLDS